MVVDSMTLKICWFTLRSGDGKDHRIWIIFFLIKALTEPIRPVWKHLHSFFFSKLCNTYLWSRPTDLQCYQLLQGLPRYNCLPCLHKQLQSHINLCVHVCVCVHACFRSSSSCIPVNLCILTSQSSFSQRQFHFPQEHDILRWLAVHSDWVGALPNQISGWPDLGKLSALK